MYAIPIAAMGNGKLQIRIEKLARERGKSLYSLARDIGHHYTTLYRVSKGQAQSIPKGMLESLCNVLDCQPGDLLVMVESKPKSKRK